MSPAFVAISPSAVVKRVSSASVTANTLPPLTRPVSSAAIMPVSNFVPHAVMFAALRLVPSTFANVLSAVVFVYASVIPYSSRVVPAFALPATVVCNELILDALVLIALLLSSTAFTRPLVESPTVSSKAVTFTTNPSLSSFIVSFNALIEAVCPLTVDFSVVISLVLVATLVFKLPTVIEESAAPSLTSSVILPELIEVTFTA